MKKLTKKHLAERDELHKTLSAAKDDVDAAIIDFNAAIDTAYSTYEEAVNKLNELLQEAREFIEQIVDEQQTYYDEKSEKWQEGEAGERHSDWKDNTESVSQDLEDVDLADKPEIDECDVNVDRLLDLPEEPGTM